MRIRFVLAVGGLVTVFTFPLTVIAQELDEIIVTAQRREQSLQDVPISLEAVSGEDIQQQGFRDLGQLSQFLPTLNISPDTQNQVIMIRGVGTQGSNFGFEQAVPMFLDGVHFGRGSQVHNVFLDVERIEVLRGPQPVFFGQNATAGAISIVTRKPGLEWDGHAVAEVGNNGTRRIELAAGGPLSDTFRIRIAGKHDTTDGFMTDMVSGDDFPHEEAFVGRAILQWVPSDKIEVTVKAEFADVETGGGAIALVGNDARPDTGRGVLAPGTGFEWDAPDGVGPFVFPDEIDNVGIRHGGMFFTPPLTVRCAFIFCDQDLLDLSQVADDLNLHARQESDPWNGYLEINYQLPGDILLSSRSALSDYFREYIHPFGSGGPFVTAPLRRQEDMNQFSQELRFTSPDDGTIAWMAGIYYQEHELLTEAQFYVAAFEQRILPALSGTETSEEAEWYSAFATITYNVTDDLSFDVGGRYTDVNKAGSVIGMSSQWIVEGGGPPTAHGQVAIGAEPITPDGRSVSDEYSVNDFNPQVVVRWRPTETLSLYAKWAEAFKAGGFETAVVTVVSPADYVFDAEIAEIFEVGARGTFWDGRVQANLTLFTSTFDNLQLSSFDEQAGRNRTTNIGKQKVQGAEFGGSIALTEQLTLHMSGALLDGVMESFPGATCNDFDVANGLCTGVGGTVDRSGQDAIRTPDWQAVVNVDYWMPVTDRYQLSFNANFLGSDGYLINDNFDPAVKMETYTDLNLLVGFGTRDGTWQVSLWGRNLTEPLPTYFPNLDFGDEGGSADVHASYFRTYGLQLNYSFF